MSTNNPIMTGPVGTREPGLFHHLLIGDFQQITGLISQATRQWTSHCVANNVTSATQTALEQVSRLR